MEAALTVAIIACVFAGISAIPVVKNGYGIICEAWLRRRFGIGVYDVDSPSFTSKLKDLLEKPELIKYVTLRCPQWDEILKSKDPTLADYKKNIAKKSDDFCYVLRFLFESGSLSTFQIQGMTVNDLFEIVRNYARCILDPKYKYVSGSNVNVEIWKTIKNHKGDRQRVSFKFDIDKSKKSQEQLSALRVQMADVNFFDRDDKIKSVYPTMMTYIGNLREYDLKDAVNVLFLTDYNIGWG